MTFRLQSRRVFYSLILLWKNQSNAQRNEKKKSVKSEIYGSKQKHCTKKEVQKVSRNIVYNLHKNHVLCLLLAVNNITYICRSIINIFCNNEKDDQKISVTSDLDIIQMRTQHGFVYCIYI